MFQRYIFLIKKVISFTTCAILGYLKVNLASGNAALLANTADLKIVSQYSLILTEILYQDHLV